jgi:hypothetical protein
MTAISFENRHTQPLPELPADGMRGYFENAHGEQLIFSQAPGEPEASLWHGDNGYARSPVKAGRADDLILTLGEALWPAACWAESAHLRHPGEHDEARYRADADELAAAFMDAATTHGYFGEACGAVLADTLREARATGKS